MHMPVNAGISLFGPFIHIYTDLCVKKNAQEDALQGRREITKCPSIRADKTSYSTSADG